MRDEAGERERKKGGEGKRERRPPHEPSVEIFQKPAPHRPRGSPRRDVPDKRSCWHSEPHGAAAAFPAFWNSAANDGRPVTYSHHWSASHARPDVLEETSPHTACRTPSTRNTELGEAAPRPGVPVRVLSRFTPPWKTSSVLFHCEQTSAAYRLCFKGTAALFLSKVETAQATARGRPRDAGGRSPRETRRREATRPSSDNSPALCPPLSTQPTLSVLAALLWCLGKGSPPVR